MSNLNELHNELREIIHNTQSPIITRASQITDDLMVRYEDLFGEDDSLKSIGDIATRIKDSRATEGENGVMWSEVIHLVHGLLNE